MKRELVHADLRNPHYVEWIRFLRESENWSREKIADYQLGEIKRVVNYAYENTKAYRLLYQKAGITPESIKNLEGVRSLPYVEKEMIRDDLEGFSSGLRRRAYVTTGGSTGIPFGFYRDSVAFARELASKAYQYYRVGWKEGDKQMVFRGAPIRSRNRMSYYPRFSELRCSSYYLLPEWMEIYRQRAFDFKPDWVKCYPSSGYAFAQFLKESGRPFPPVKGILCASENMYQFQKELMSEAWGCRVFSHYGHYELAVLAGFCEKEETYHVLPQYGYAELIGPDGRPVTEPGRMGEIVGTSFIMRATPFVRYRTRDLAVFKSWECRACGRPYQVWERIEGRSQEFIVTRTGRWISMTAINMHDDIFDHIKQFQFYQEKRGSIVFRFIPKDNCDEAAIAGMRAGLLTKLGDDAVVQMEPVDEIAPTARGKHRFLVQKLDVPFGIDDCKF